MRVLIKIVLSISIIISSSSAALAPWIQNSEDLDVMVNFIKKHQVVSSKLKSIDFENYIVYFDKNCKATFKRKKSFKPKGWVGPADPLIFKNSNCKLY